MLLHNICIRAQAYSDSEMYVPTADERSRDRSATRSAMEFSRNSTTERAAFKTKMISILKLWLKYRSGETVTLDELQQVYGPEAYASAAYAES